MEARVVARLDEVHELVGDDHLQAKRRIGRQARVDADGAGRRRARPPAGFHGPDAPAARMHAHGRLDAFDHLGQRALDLAPIQLVDEAPVLFGRHAGRFGPPVLQHGSEGRGARRGAVADARVIERAFSRHLRSPQHDGLELFRAVRGGGDLASAPHALDDPRALAVQELLRGCHARARGDAHRHGTVPAYAQVEIAHVLARDGHGDALSGAIDVEREG